jgi:hypothetical protein
VDVLGRIVAQCVKFYKPVNVKGGMAYRNSMLIQIPHTVGLDPRRCVRLPCSQLLTSLEQVIIIL